MEIWKEVIMEQTVSLDPCDIEVDALIIASDPYCGSICTGTAYMQKIRKIESCFLRARRLKNYLEDCCHGMGSVDGVTSCKSRLHERGWILRCEVEREILEEALAWGR
ncbi:MAG: hypothetical protein ACLTLQ_03765 [[Clostridium] scindens]